MDSKTQNLLNDAAGYAESVADPAARAAINLLIKAVESLGGEGARTTATGAY